ncbi:RTA1-domain-containing protein [Penicillium malachiteum]|uniref:RTA1-domain-containing protein n=1 Tax=Penicillium malachiteum TaxID=1324776 RepID=A0AAD6HP91_9EURO|nr:RTA1-domain-containing protein [Penicillium malachiteum]
MTVSSDTIGCVAYVEGIGTSYGYVPHLSAGVVFVVLFSLSMIIHTIQFCWKRVWWGVVFSLGCMVEVLGWAARLWSSQCPYNGDAFLMQISTLIIAPTFFTAGIYIILGRFIQLLGPESSILKPNTYLWIFCTCDILSLVIQAAGGGMASAAVNSVNGNTAPGTHTMVAGIVFQLFSVTIFVFCAIDFIRRSLRHNLLQEMNGTILPLLYAMIFSVVCIYIRSIYRTIELSQGWSGYLITHEKYFIALDGAMMICAVGVFNIINPGWFLPQTNGRKRETYSSDEIEMNVPSSS